MTRVVETYEPDAAARALYDDLYRRVYLRLYGRLGRSTRRSGITGYPPVL